ARAEARLLGRGSAGEEAHVLSQRRARRADGAAIDAGGLHGGEEPPVEARVSAPGRAVAGLLVEQHRPVVYRSRHLRLAGIGRVHRNQSPPSSAALCFFTAPMSWDELEEIR